MRVVLAATTAAMMIAVVAYQVTARGLSRVTRRSGPKRRTLRGVPASSSTVHVSLAAFIHVPWLFLPCRWPSLLVTSVPLGALA